LGIIFLYIFILSYFLRLTSRVPVFGTIHFELCLGLVVLIISIMQQKNGDCRLSILTIKRIYYFFIYVIISLPVVTWPGSVLRYHFLDWVKVSLFFVFIVVLIRSVEQLKFFFYIFMGTQIFRVFEPLYLHITTGYWGSSAHSTVGGDFTTLQRLSGAPHDVVNPNQLAWVIVNMVPFLFYLLWKGNRMGKIVALAFAPPLVYALLLTGSRSGLLSLLFVLLAMVFYSKNRVRNMGIALAIAVPLALLSFHVIGGDLQTRYLSLIDSSVAGADTAKGRVNALIRGVQTMSNNPLFGNGLGTSAETNFNVLGGRSQKMHNLYLEVFQEVGLIGFVLFFMYVASIFKALNEAQKKLFQAQADNSWLFRLVVSIQVWLVMDLFYSLSCFGLNSWEWYFFGGVSVCCLVFSRKIAAEKDGRIALEEDAYVS